MKPLDLDAVAKAKVDDAFAEDAWLTFYLFGDPWRHDALKPALVALGARNLVGAEGGMVYAKVPVTLDAKDIEQTVDEVRHLASGVGLDIHIIDLDSGDNVERSKFYSLWNAG
jgi:hypothetical protein